MRKNAMAIYKDLDVWQAAMSLVTVCYAATQKYPREEIFGITSQLRRRPCQFQATLPRAHAARATEST